MIPAFIDLMEDWRAEFNKSNKDGLEMYYHDFTQNYICIKVKTVGENSLHSDHKCVGHLYTGKDAHGNGVEFINQNGDEFIRPEDPTFFDRISTRVNEKLKG